MEIPKSQHPIPPVILLSSSSFRSHPIARRRLRGGQFTIQCRKLIKLPLSVADFFDQLLTVPSQVCLQMEVPCKVHPPPPPLRVITISFCRGGIIIKLSLHFRPLSWVSTSCRASLSKDAVPSPLWPSPTIFTTSFSVSSFSYHHRHSKAAAPPLGYDYFCICIISYSLQHFFSTASSPSKGAPDESHNSTLFVSGKTERVINKKNCQHPKKIMLLFCLCLWMCYVIAWILICKNVLYARHLISPLITYSLVCLNLNK